MKVLITGSSGFVGSFLIESLKKHGHEVIKLVRNTATLNPDERYWDPSKGFINPDNLKDIDAVINLAGENLASGRWTDEKMRRISESRVKSTELIAEALSGLEKPPKVFISASAIGFYGDQGNDLLTEESSKGTGFLTDVCEKWEDATIQAASKGIRVVNLRIGVVLDPKGGALKKMLFPFKWGLGGKLGSGDQWMSWIALEDLIAIINYALENDSLEGPINAVSPNPIKNFDFTKVLGDALHRPTLFTIPSAALRALFGQMADETLLASTHVIPKRLCESGYTFTYPELEPYLKSCLK